ncbi:MAG: erythromycin esterase family protein [Gemmatimonadota bacterium]|nr:erythromycin esterase family protein [Gemmatimonadota bacterium]
MLTRALVAASLVISPFALRAQSSSVKTPSDGGVEFTQWAARAAQPVPSIQTGVIARNGADWISRLTRNATVVGIGESAHDVHDFLALRTLLTRRLIEQGRVAAIVMETSFPDAAPIDAWLAGRSATPPDFEHLLSFDFGHESELAQIFQWLRTYNAQRPANQQVHFYGADLPSDGGGSLEPALIPVWSYMERVDGDYARRVKASIEPIARKLDTRGYDIVGRYGQLSPASRDSLHHALDELGARFAGHKQEYVSRSSSTEFAWAQRLVEIARQTEQAVRLGWNHPTNPRDSAMASNIQWISARESGRGLIVVWAHNLHVVRVPIGGPMFEARGPAVKSMGQYLQQDFGDRYVAIGTAFGTGGPDSVQVPEPLSVDAVLFKTRNPRFGVEIKSAPTRGPVAVWLNQPHLMRAENGYVMVRPRSAYDALLFLGVVHPSEHLSAR